MQHLSHNKLETDAPNLSMPDPGECVVDIESLAVRHTLSSQDYTSESGLAAS